ncbi:MAG: hypothetical protein ABR925_03800 [Acidimicrobiales bacterium]|jgi:hypothetical protein
MTTDQLAERRFRELVESVASMLTAKGSIVESVDRLTSHGGPDAVARWRRAGRAAARQLEIPVRTGISRDGTLVWITDSSCTLPGSDVPQRATH